MVASSGGHLTQLLELSSRLVPRLEQTWSSFEGDHASSALEGRIVEYIPYIPPRGYRQLARGVPRAASILRHHRPEFVVSTGSGIALAFLPIARLWGAEAHYIESATRCIGPSQTGRLLSRLPWVRLHTQHPGWSDERWSYDGSVFEGFEAVAVAPRAVERVVVTLGTMETYGFRRLVERLIDILPDDVDVTWQVGVTDVSGLNMDARRSIPSAELQSAIGSADVVIGHAGTGIALTCFSLGIRPLLVPRSPDHGEHVDNHQYQTAEYLGRLDLASVCEADRITFDDLRSVTGWRVVRVARAPDYVLG